MTVDLEKIQETTKEIVGKCSKIDALIDYAKMDEIGPALIKKSITATDKTKLIDEYKLVKAELEDLVKELP